VLYAFPILLASVTMPRGAIVLLAAACALLREQFGPYHWQQNFALRVAMVGGALSVVGLLLSELNRNRKLERDSLQARERHLVGQQESARELSTLVNTSPLPIVVADASGTVKLANEACCALLGVSQGRQAVRLFDHLPELETALQRTGGTQSLRTEIECAGANASGEPFLAHVWLTRYQTSSGPQIAVALWDASEDLRGRELASVESLMKTSRVLIAGFAHEVRNISLVADSLAQRISERLGLVQDEECTALKTTLHNLSELAASGLRAGVKENRSIVDLSVTLEQARIVMEPVLEGAEIELIWDVPKALPRVQADHLLVTQVMLNLALNSGVATRRLTRREFRVTACAECEGAMIEVTDNGPGVQDPGTLFRPFHSGGSGSGLGLYVSRAMLRSCGGDLWYERGRAGACFCIRLKEAATSQT
jgi:two-component system, LuxR family, sensor kinase FixL